MLWLAVGYNKGLEGKLYAYLAREDEKIKQSPSIDIYCLSDSNTVILEDDNNHYFTYDELWERMKTVASNLVTKDGDIIPVRIYADENAPLQSFVNVLNICKKAGVQECIISRLKPVNLDTSKITRKEQMGYIPKDTSFKLKVSELLSLNPYLKKSIGEKGGLTGWLILLFGLGIIVIAGMYLIRMQKLKMLSNGIISNEVLKEYRNLNIFPLTSFIVLLIGFIGILISFYGLFDTHGAYDGICIFKFIGIDNMLFIVYKMLVIIVESIFVASVGIIAYSYFISRLNFLVNKKESD